MFLGELGLANPSGKHEIKCKAKVYEGHLPSPPPGVPRNGRPLEGGKGTVTGLGALRKQDWSEVRASRPWRACWSGLRLLRTAAREWGERGRLSTSWGEGGRATRSQRSAAAPRRGEARDKGREASSGLKEGERQAPASPPWVRHSRHPEQSLELQGRGGSLPRRACFP